MTTTTRPTPAPKSIPSPPPVLAVAMHPNGEVVDVELRYDEIRWLIDLIEDNWHWPIAISQLTLRKLQHLAETGDEHYENLMRPAQKRVRKTLKTVDRGVLAIAAWKQTAKERWEELG